MRSLRPWAAAVGAVTLCLATAPAAWAAPGAPCDPQNQGVANRTEPWGQQRLDFQKVWPLTRGRGVLIAEVDSGVDATHPQLSGQVLPTVDLTHTRSADCNGHGTRVAGIIVGRDLGGQGIAFTGVAPDARLLPIKQTDGSDNDNGVPLLAQGIRTAADRGAKVVNVSITTSANVPRLAKAVRYAQAHDVVVVAAAGNEDSPGEQSGPKYPAEYPGVVSVAAIDEKGEHASFAVAATRVSVAAPGVHVISTAAGPRHGYNIDDGTSFAAPFVAGVAALVRAYHPELNYQQVEHRIEVTADRSTDPLLGFGVVNPYQAVTAVLPEESDATVAQPAPRAIPPVATVGRGDSRVRTLALVCGGVAALLTLLIVCGAVVLPRGRRRNWRPGRRPQPPGEAGTTPAVG
ncbi:MAG TPA: type VII secretion-associated serine protease mycosin [Mycobacteriales bacterium]|nr:type VII secretion-associated serine protease mycosin [Mycobacteriales bacterium]